MNKYRILFASLVVLVVQISCKAPERGYPSSMPTPIYAEVPSLLTRGEKHIFSVDAAPGIECHAGIAFYDIDDNWIKSDLPTIKANDVGVCQWTWEIPENAKDGIGEFRGYIGEVGQSTNIFPANFCIEKCP